MKKYVKTSLIFTLLIAICFFNACLYTAKSASIGKEDLVQLNFRITWDKYSGRGESIANTVNLYNESQNNVHVNLYGGNENKDDYAKAFDEDIIDVYVIPYRFVMDRKIYPELYQFSNQFDSDLDNYYDTLLKLIKTQNKIVGMPWVGHSMGLVFNKSLTEKAGVNPYEWKSVDDLILACKKIEDKTDAAGIGLVGADHHDVTWMVSQFIYSFGGKLVSFDSDYNESKVAINSAKTIEGLDFYYNSLGEYAQQGWQEATGVEVLDAFVNQDIAFEIQGPWAISDIWKRSSEMEIGAIALSQIGVYSEVGPLLLSVSKDSEHIEEAISFIRFMLDSETLEIIMEGEYDEKYDAYYPYRVPLRKDMRESEFFKKYPEFLVFIQGYEMPSINSPCEDWETERKEKYSYYLHQLALGNISIEDALIQIEK